jgi:hypothetical protein
MGSMTNPAFSHSMTLTMTSNAMPTKHRKKSRNPSPTMRPARSVAQGSSSLELPTTIMTMGRMGDVSRMATPIQNEGSVRACERE